MCHEQSIEPVRNFFVDVGTTTHFGAEIDAMVGVLKRGLFDIRHRNDVKSTSNVKDSSFKTHFGIDFNNQNDIVSTSLGKHFSPNVS